MPSCAVSTCKSTSFNAKKNPKLFFIRFPNLKLHRDLAIKWWKLCQRDDDDVPPLNAVICSKHFEPSCFERDLRSELLGQKTRHRIKKNALPSLDLPAVKIKIVSSSRFAKNDRSGPSSVFKDVSLSWAADDLQLDRTNLSKTLERSSLIDPSFRAHMQAVAEKLESSEKSSILSKDKYNAICHHLKFPWKKIDSDFREWIRKFQFQLLDIPGRKKKQLAVPRHIIYVKQRADVKLLRVVHCEQLTDVVWLAHAYKNQHGSFKKLFNFIRQQYFGIDEQFLRVFCKCCPVCQQPQALNRLSLQPVRNKEFLGHVHVDVIDMSRTPDGDFRFIGHFMDHFSELHVLFPLRKNTAEEVSLLLEERVFSYFGIPKVFHSGNGNDFVNWLICAMFDRIGGDFLFVNGQVHHPFLADRLKTSNHLIKSRIETIKQEVGLQGNTFPWASWLPSIMNLMMRGSKISVSNVTVPAWLTSFLGKSDTAKLC